MAYLTATSGATFGKRIELIKATTIMGRHPDCDVVIEVGAVSRQHAQIESTTSGFQLQDLNSRNGTYLNGNLVESPTILKDSDIIRICDVEYSFHNPLLQGSSELKIGGSSFGIMLVDERADQTNNMVQNKLDLRGSSSGTQLTTSAESRLKVVTDISQSLGRAVSLDEVLPKVLDSLFRIFLQADRGFIVLIENGQIVPKWIKTRREEHQETFRISRTVIREVMETKEAIISLDASSDERFELAQSISSFRIRSMIVAPLLDSQGEAIGAIQMDTLDPKRQFQKEDMEILASVAIQAGISVENAQLHEVLVERQRVEQDLMLARQVQQAFLPVGPPVTEGYEFYNFYMPADQIGGDYYDYLQLPDKKLAVVVADVVGHGVAAAMLMAKLSAETRYCLASYENLAQAVALLNKRITNLGLERFVTLLCIVLDPATGQIQLVNAGHMMPIWLRGSTNQLESLDEDLAGLPLGILDDSEYQQLSFQLGSGDRLILYTDGISEAPDAAGIMFGIPRLNELAFECNGNISQLGQRIVDDVNRHARDTRQADDMCLVILRRE